MGMHLLKRNMETSCGLHRVSVLSVPLQVDLLNGNLMRVLPSGFGSLVNLVELRLDENQLKELPEDFGHLRSLEIVDFGEWSSVSFVGYLYGTCSCINILWRLMIGF